MPGRAEGGSSSRYGSEHERGAEFDIIGGEAKDSDALAGEPIGAPLVAGLLVIMGRAVDFHGELRGRAVEIEDVGANGVLAAEVEAALVAAEQGPESALGLGQGAAHRPGAVADEIR